MPSDEEIRSLCARVLNARGKEFDAAIADLQSAIEQRLTERDEPEADESN
jgi:Flp pilus assembly protein TadD